MNGFGIEGFLDRVLPIGDRNLRRIRLFHRFKLAVPLYLKGSELIGNFDRQKCWRLFRAVHDGEPGRSQQH